MRYLTAFIVGIITPQLVRRVWGVFVAPVLARERVPGLSHQCGACKGITTKHLHETENT